MHFTQAAAVAQAQALMSVNVGCTKEEKAQIAELIGNFRVQLELRQDAVPAGPARHRRPSRRHAARYRRLIETLAQVSLLKVICGTDTLGVGINVPIRTVPVRQGCRSTTESRSRLLQAREFHQIAGRAGRGSLDTMGYVVAQQAPEHVIENERALAKAGDDPKKRRKVVRKRPPEGAIGWGEPTFDRLVHAEPEPLKPSFSGHPRDAAAERDQPTQATRSRP